MTGQSIYRPAKSYSTAKPMIKLLSSSVFFFIVNHLFFVPFCALIVINNLNVLLWLIQFFLIDWQHYLRK